MVATQNDIELARLELAKEVYRAFDGARKSRRTQSWVATNRGPNADIKGAIGTLITRCQDLVDSDPWCGRAVSVIVNNTIGEGIEGAPAKATKAYNRGWQEWASSPLCDFYEKLNLFGLQSLAMRTVAVRGSVLVRKHIAPDLFREGLVPLQIQVMEPDWLDSTRDDGMTIVGGKTYDSRGKWTGAWLWDQHPGESGISGLRMKSEWVPKSELLHIYDVRRPGQYTGVPWGAAALLLARDITDYASAELLKQKLAACFAGFVTDANPDSDEEGDDITETIEPGLIQRLGAGQSMTFSDPPKVEGFGDFMPYNLRALAAAWGITYESLTGNLSDVNFSSGRMGWLEFHRNVGHWRWNITIPQMLDPIGGWYRELAQLTISGRIARGMVWTPPRREMINPKEEIGYLADAVRAGFMSLSEVQRSFGYVPEELLDELKKDLDEARSRGLALSVDGQMDVGRLQARAFADQAQGSGGASQGDAPVEPQPQPPAGDPLPRQARGGRVRAAWVPIA